MQGATQPGAFVRGVAVAILLAAMAAAFAVGGTAGPSARAEDAVRRAALAAPNRFGGPLCPAPLVSRGRPVAASRPGAHVLVDGEYRTGSWGGGVPSEAAPAWVAIRVGARAREVGAAEVEVGEVGAGHEVGEVGAGHRRCAVGAAGAGPRRVLLSWTSSHNHDYRDLFYGAPVDYRIETSADSSDGLDGTWRIAATIRGSSVRSRAHAVEFEGQAWIRLAVTALPADRNAWGLFLDEIDVHDLSHAGDDVWVFLGDSIGAGVFDRAPAHRPSFADRIASSQPGYAPAMIDAGFCRATTGEVLARIDDVLALNPDARVFAITLGANDPDPETFRRDLDALVARIQAAGRIPVVARIPYQTKYGDDFVAPKNAALDEVVRARGLLPGPDLYGWFRARPKRLADGLHPDAQGSVDVNRLWAESVAPLYPPSPPPYASVR